LLVAGYALWGDGYPNARNTVRILREHLDLPVISCGFRLPEDFHLWRLARAGKSKAAFWLTRLLLGNLASAILVLARARRNDIVYVPYPSIFLLWLLSWIPRRWRPNCICDAYITLWDTLFEDRSLGGASTGWASRVLLSAESRALRAAERVVVDTTANADHVSARFGLHRSRVSAIPLAIDTPNHAAATSLAESDGIINVLFVGTFVPLQGTAKIAEAIALLRDDETLRFTLIGDGQDAAGVADALLSNPRVSWLRHWMSPAQIEAHMRSTDICLGVFGGSGKASRVLPFKLYAALAAGKPVITQRDYGLPDGVPAIPARLVEAAPAAMADAIQQLARAEASREALSSRANQFFEEHLSARRIAAHWRAWLT